LPNFPHSSACDSRACQRLGAFLTDGGENPLCVRLIEFVHLRGDHQVSPAVRLEPSLQFQIVGHPAAAGIQNEKRSLKCGSCQQIIFNELLPAVGLLPGNLGVTISWQVDEITCARVICGSTSDPIIVDRLCATRRVTGVSEPLVPDQGVDQAGLSDVTSP